jgi:hypothetical protein
LRESGTKYCKLTAKMKPKIMLNWFTNHWPHFSAENNVN